MKKFTVLIVMLLLCVGSLFAQVPEKFNYQAVVRNASNALVTNAQVGVRVSILQGSAAGSAVYVETHTATTNANGLLTLEIGGGTVQQGAFAGIDWANGPFFLKTEIDPAGGSNYTIISTQQLLSVPYALYAETAGNGFSGDYNDLTNKPTIPQNLGDLTNDAGYVTLDSIPAQVNADWNATEGAAEILNKPTLFSGDYNDLTNKPVNADFGQGLVRAKVNNPSGATDINVTFTGYSLVTGGVVSLLFQRSVPADATLNINNQGAKPIYYHESALTDGVIKANDRCLFMYNSTMERYYLLAIDRWGVDLEALATVAHTGSYNDLTDKPTIPTVPTNISAFVNDAGYITAIPDSMGGISLESDPIFSAWDKDYDDLINTPDLAPVATSGNYDDLTNKPNLAPVATSGNYNDLTNKPTIPTVPTNISAFVNDAGYLTAIPDSLGGISLETDPVFSAWNKDYNDLTNKPDLAPVATSGNYNDLTDKPTIPAVPANVSAFDNDMGYITSEDIPAQVNADWDATSGPAQILNKPVNADFGQGIVRTTINNTAGATDIAVPFTGYAAVTGGVVSLSFKRAVPAEATLNINNQGAKPILYKGTALTAGVIKAGDRCLFMYNSTTDSYYLLANDRWGADIDGLAAVAYSGSYNDLTDKPTLFSGNYNDLTDKPTLPTNVSDLNNDAGFITQEQIPVQVNADWNATNGPAQILNKPTIPTVPTNISAFFNDMGYITAIPDSLGGISIESDPIFSAWNKDYNDLTNKPELFSGNYDDLTNKPVNADFGQGIVRTTVNNTAGATDIAVPFTGYAAVTGGVVSLSFKRAVPAEATLNINNQGAKPILYKGTALTAGVIKAGDRCLFMYNSTTDSYYLLSNDRWGADIDGLATVAHTGSYNDLTDKPNLAPVATSGNYNDLTNTPTIPTVPTSLSDFDNDMGFINIDDVPAQVNADWDATSGPAQILNKPVNADFGQGLVRTTINNTAGATDIAVSFTGYAAVTGGVVSLSFKRAVPADATLNINNQGAKPILYKGTALTAGVIKAGDRCLFMYNSTTDSYYLLANDRWGADIDGLATVAYSGNYNDLADKPVLSPVAISGNYSDLTGTPTIPADNNLVHIAGDETITGSKIITSDFAVKSTTTSGVTPFLSFQRGTATDTYVDWKINNESGALQFFYSKNGDNTKKFEINNTKALFANNVEAAQFVKTGGTSSQFLKADGSVDNNTYLTQHQDISGKANTADLANVAFSGNYSDLTGTPEINNGKLTIKQNGTSLGSFYANQSANTTISFTTLTEDQVQAMIDAAMSDLQQQVDSLQDQLDSIQDVVRSMNTYLVPSDGSQTVTLNSNHVYVYDAGGPDGQYGDYWEGSLTLVTTDINKVFKISGSYNTEHYGSNNSYDHLSIYNGSNITIGNNRIVKLEGIGTISEPIYSTGNTITIYFHSDNSVERDGFALSIEIVSKPSCEDAKAVDVQGNYYSTVQIGSQCWMKENLRTTKYADGTSISASSSTTGDSETVPYYANYSSHPLPLEKRGYLYNWAAVMHSESPSSANPSGVQGICPSGWHVPSDAEWNTMEATQTSATLTVTDFRGDHAGKLAGEGWNSSTSANTPGKANDPNHNASGFSAVPAGSGYSNSIGQAGVHTYFWTATADGSDVYERFMYYASAGVKRDKTSVTYFFESVRCVRN